MSQITDVMLSFSPLERQEKRGDEWEFSVILRINEWLEQTGYRQLLSIADGAGSKAFQAQLDPCGGSQRSMVDQQGDGSIARTGRSSMYCVDLWMKYGELNQEDIAGILNV